jgi:hypothetical protein
MKEMNKEEKSSPILSLIRDRKLAFANLVRAYLRFNVESVTQVEVVEREDRDVMILINGNLYKFDVSDYTGKEDRYIFYNPSNGRIVIEAGDVQKVFKLDVDLIDK